MPRVADSMSQPDTTQLKNLLNASRSIVILLPRYADYDMFASALAIKIAIESAGKLATVAYSEAITVEFNRLVGIDTVVNNFGGRNLIITFPGQTEYVDKVSYNLDKGELQLVITPKPSAPDLDPRRLKFISSGSQYDLVITVGANSLEDLGPLYVTNKETLQSVKMLSINHNLPTQNFAPNQIYDPQASSLSEITAFILESTGFPLNIDSASNLLAGLEKATNHFQSSIVSSTTFEAASLLLRRGARRQDVFSPDNLPPGSIPQNPTPSIQMGYGTDSQMPLPETAVPVTTAPPSPDWYEPKIFQGTSLS